VGIPVHFSFTTVLQIIISMRKALSESNSSPTDESISSVHNECAVLNIKDIY
jgi:hypothetical protein